MSIDLESLGFTKEELQERIIDRLCGQVMSGKEWDDDGNEITTDSQFARKLEKAVKDRIDLKISEMAEKYVLPRVSEYVENLTLEETNRWGEKKGEKLTFIEYLIHRAEAYMTEKVDYQGKSQAEDRYNWKGTQTRLSYLVHEHLHYSIETALKNALKIVNSNIANEIAETVKMKLAEVEKQLQVTVRTK